MRLKYEPASEPLHISPSDLSWRTSDVQTWGVIQGSVHVFSWYRCRGNMAHVRQSRPSAGLGLPTEAPKSLKLTPLGSRTVIENVAAWLEALSLLANRGCGRGQIQAAEGHFRTQAAKNDPRRILGSILFGVCGCEIYRRRPWGGRRVGCQEGAPFRERILY